MTKVPYSVNLHSNEKKSTYVARWLTAQIETGEWKIGDKLPSERMLAKKLHVSRTAVREAIVALSVRSLVRSVVGDGNYVSSAVDSLNDVESALQALKESESLNEIWAIRRQIELVIGQLVSERSEKRSLNALQHAISIMAKAVQCKDVEEYVAANNSFHIALAKAAKNPFLLNALLPLLQITNQQMVINTTADNGLSIIAKHEAIIKALKRKDPKEVLKSISYHFQLSEESALMRQHETKGGDRAPEHKQM